MLKERIFPKDIRTDVLYIASFGSAEMEGTAQSIVALCQRRNPEAWEPFPKTDVHDQRGLHELELGQHIIIKGEEVEVTDEFVRQVARFVVKD